MELPDGICSNKDLFRSPSVPFCLEGRAPPVSGSKVKRNSLPLAERSAPSSLTKSSSLHQQASSRIEQVEVGRSADVLKDENAKNTRPKKRKVLKAVLDAAKTLSKFGRPRERPPLDMRQSASMHQFSHTPVSPASVLGLSGCEAKSVTDVRPGAGRRLQSLDASSILANVEAQGEQSQQHPLPLITRDDEHQTKMNVLPTVTVRRSASARRSYSMEALPLRPLRFASSQRLSSFENRDEEPVTPDCHGEVPAAGGRPADPQAMTTVGSGVKYTRSRSGAGLSTRRQMGKRQKSFSVLFSSTYRPKGREPSDTTGEGQAFDRSVAYNEMCTEFERLLAPVRGQYEEQCSDMSPRPAKPKRKSVGNVATDLAASPTPPANKNLRMPRNTVPGTRTSKSLTTIDSHVDTVLSLEKIGKPTKPKRQSRSSIMDGDDDDEDDGDCPSLPLRKQPLSNYYCSKTGSSSGTVSPTNAHYEDGVFTGASLHNAIQSLLGKPEMDTVSLTDPPFTNVRFISVLSRDTPQECPEDVATYPAVLSALDGVTDVNTLNVHKETALQTSVDSLDRQSIQWKDAELVPKATVQRSIHMSEDTASTYSHVSTDKSSAARLVLSNGSNWLWDAADDSSADADPGRDRSLSLRVQLSSDAQFVYDPSSATLKVGTVVTRMSSMDSLDSRNICWKEDEKPIEKPTLRRAMAVQRAGKGITDQHELMLRWASRRKKLKPQTSTTNLIESFERRELELAKQLNAEFSEKRPSVPYECNNSG